MAHKLTNVSRKQAQEIKALINLNVTDEFHELDLMNLETTEYKEDDFSLVFYSYEDAVHAQELLFSQLGRDSTLSEVDFSNEVGSEPMDLGITLMHRVIVH